MKKEENVVEAEVTEVPTKAEAFGDRLTIAGAYLQANMDVINIIHSKAGAAKALVHGLEDDAISPELEGVVEAHIKELEDVVETFKAAFEQPVVE